MGDPLCDDNCHGARARQYCLIFGTVVPKNRRISPQNCQTPHPSQNMPAAWKRRPAEEGPTMTSMTADGLRRPSVRPAPGAPRDLMELLSRLAGERPDQEALAGR